MPTDESTQVKIGERGSYFIKVSQMFGECSYAGNLHWNSYLHGDVRRIAPNLRNLLMGGWPQTELFQTCLYLPNTTQVKNANK